MSNYVSLTAPVLTTITGDLVHFNSCYVFVRLVSMEEIITQLSRLES
jgi:hypothetical protein